MKTYFSCLLAIVFSISVVGCGGSDDSSDAGAATVATSQLKLPEKLEVVTNENE